MLDAAKQRHWYRLYLLSALIAEKRDTINAAERWARAMSLIAEQFAAYDSEPTQ